MLTINEILIASRLKKIVGGLRPGYLMHKTASHTGPYPSVKSITSEFSKSHHSQESSKSKSTHDKKNRSVNLRFKLVSSEKGEQRYIKQ